MTRLTDFTINFLIWNVFQLFLFFASEEKAKHHQSLQTARALFGKHSYFLNMFHDSHSTISTLQLDPKRFHPQFVRSRSPRMVASSTKATFFILLRNKYRVQRGPVFCYSLNVLRPSHVTNASGSQFFDAIYRVSYRWSGTTCSWVMLYFIWWCNILLNW